MIKRIFISMLLLVGFFVINVSSQNNLLGIGDFKKPLGEWFEAGEVCLKNENEKQLDAIAGKGVLFNGEKGRTKHLITKESHGDAKLLLEFMVPKGSNSGVYLQRRYEIQILDSWGKEKLGSGDCGGIYQRWDETRQGEKGFEGTPPPLNASKKPGEWQTLFIIFNAPRFNSQGVKLKNAKFKKVKLNGITLHRNVEVTGPTRSSLDELETPLGHLMLQGDHGPVAYRNIKLRKQ
jgi:hypothetical protein